MGAIGLQRKLNCFLFLAFGFAASQAAASVNLQGTVFNEFSKRIPEVSATLLNRKLMVLTDSTGRFDFTRSIQIKRPSDGLSTVKSMPVILRGRMVFNLEASWNNLRVGVFDVSGRRVFFRNHSRIGPGRFGISVDGFAEANGLYFVKATVNRRTHFTKLLMIGNRPVGTTKSPVPWKEAPVPVMQKQQTAATDSLQLVKSGYHQKTIPVFNLTDSLNVIMSDSFGQLVEWPNAESRANSDPWLMKNHRKISIMRPRIMAINFVNKRSMADMQNKLTQLVNAVSEASRYKGYGDNSATAFVQYDLAYQIDLRDNPVPGGYEYENSTHYPREDPKEGYWGFDYERLFSKEYADLFAIKDPGMPSRNMSLSDLFERGFVHEVWIYGDASVQKEVNKAEILEHKPFYDRSFLRIADSTTRAAGNGAFDKEDSIPCKVTVRIAGVNHNRGPGCFLENICHGFESTGRINAVPYLTDYFPAFGNFNLDSLYGAPTRSWYGCPYTGGYCLDYVSQTSVAYDYKGETGTISNYDPVCGNVHFMPNGRGHYDITNTQPVLTSCEHFMDGTGKKSLFAASVFSDYAALGQDCMGPFLIWWMQNFPGLNNNSSDGNGNPMRNWWPFIYY